MTVYLLLQQLIEIVAVRIGMVASCVHPLLEMKESNLTSSAHVLVSNSILGWEMAMRFACSIIPISFPSTQTMVIVEMELSMMVRNVIVQLSIVVPRGAVMVPPAGSNRKQNVMEHLGMGAVVISANAR